MEGESQAASSSSASAAMPLYKCRHFEIHKREIGSIRPSLYARRIGGCEDLVQRFKEYKKLAGHRGCVNTVHFNPAGDRLVSGSDDMHIIFWDWMAGRKKLTYHSGHEQNVFQARVMPFSDDSSVVTSAADGQVRHAMISENGRVEIKRLGKHRGPCHKIAIEPGSPRTFFSCGEDGIVQHFDLRDNRSTKLLTCYGYDGRSKLRFPVLRLNSIVINPRNPNYFAIGGADEYARVYDIRRIDPGEDTPVSYYAPKHLVGHSHVHITCVAYSNQEELLVSYNDELIYLFEKGMELEEIRPDLRTTSDEEVNSDSPYHSDDEEVPTNTRQKDDKEEEHDKENTPTDDEDKDGKVPQVYKGHRNSQTIKGVNFFGPDTQYVISGSDCGHIFIWEKKGGKLLSMFKGGKRVVNCLEPHPYSAFLATSGMDKTIKLWAPTNDVKDPFPPNYLEIMEKNRLNRQNMSSIPFTPEIIMRVLHLQHAQFIQHDEERQGSRRRRRRSQTDEEDTEQHAEVEEGSGGFFAASLDDSEDESSDGSPRECIIS